MKSGKLLLLLAAISLWACDSQVPEEVKPDPVETQEPEPEPDLFCANPEPGETETVTFEEWKI